MENNNINNYKQGDLTDILRATGGNTAAETRQFSSDINNNNNIPVNFSPDPTRDDFGDPFTHFRDPLLETPASGFFHQRSDNTVGFASVVGGNDNININDDDDHEMRRPNYFSRMLQISPVNAKLSCDSPVVGSPTGLKPGAPPVLVSNDRSLIISPNSSKGNNNNNCLMVESSSLQISSPRNTGGIRRRKSQAKKVVCIPAPTPANSSRASGEIVPSDLWAWRKYGQKPIKGSPYPRGYYRCSSSKGCSARKQVERSRTDPNMLVITYTSEHNHPWPTQRNALAGSTRSQPSKTITTTPKSPPNSNPKEEHKEIAAEDPAPSSTANTVKEELMDHDFDNQIEMDDADQGFPNSYKPTLMLDSNHAEDSFFADLGEIEADSLDILFTDDNKALDTFSFYDWGGSNATATSISSGGGAATSDTGGATTSYGEASKDS